ncbi:MAG TPA: hypothetical protein VKY19_02065 [Ktedonosporobacter sp.]|jgi:hypothetical protein|nr:hypothetical protein [Ktedonosporobacter sp.]
MLDQNLTTLLSALIGGSLSISAGFLASYYTQKTTKKNNQEKFITEMIENIYKETQSIEDLYNNILDSIKEKEEASNEKPIDYDPYDMIKRYESIEKTFKGARDSYLITIKNSLKKIDMLTTLYLYPIQDDLKIYQSKLNPFIKFLESSSDTIESLNQSISQEEFLQAGKQFQIALSKLLKKKGYSYF